MLRKTLIILLLGCSLMARSGVVVESNAKYNFQKSSNRFELQRTFTSDWGVENTSLGILQPKRISINKRSSMRVSLISSNAFSGSESNQQSVGGGSAVGFGNRSVVAISAEVSNDVAMTSSAPFSNPIQKALPVDPTDPGIIDPPATPVADGLGILLVLAFGFLLFRVKRML